MYAGHLDMTIPLWTTVDDVVSLDRCRAYIARFESSQSHTAPIIRKDGVGVDEAVRNNQRIMWDDQDEADALLASVREQMERAEKPFPEIFKGDPLACANHRLRIYRYQPGQKHGVHWDSEIELEGGALRSRMTLVFYLNDDFTGGQTAFPELDATISAKPGRALLFQHRLLHEACPVEQGTKYALRTDLFYRCS